MPVFRIRQAAQLLRVSTDTLRRWADGGRVETTTDASGRRAVDGVVLARLAQELAESADPGERTMVIAHSMRNRFPGLITRVVRDTVMAQVEIQAGPHRFVSLLSREVSAQLHHVKLHPGLSLAGLGDPDVELQLHPGHWELEPGSRPSCRRPGQLGSQRLHRLRKL